jgi:phosphatidylserine/phosphatidylglycerophosphate/cardiolipin synthase-like enzyme
MKLKTLLSASSRAVSGLLAAASLVACAPQMPMMMPAQPFATAPMMQAMRAAQGGIQVSFVKAYSRSTLENEQITRKDPNSPGAQLIRLIDSARETLDGAFYDIDNKEVVDALIRAKQRQVRVRLVTDTDNLTAKNSGPTGPARPAIVALKKARIPVIDDQRSGIMHHKFIVADGQSVWTGSTNLTDSSLFSHNNNALVLNSRELASSYSAEFERLFTDRVFGPNPPRQVPFPRVQIGNSTVDVYFSPRGGGQQAVLQALSQAKKRILFMTFSLTDKTAGEIIAAKKRQKLQIEGVFDSWLGAGQYSLFNPLKQGGMNVRKDGNEALLHHKVIIVDDTVITGSYNYSANAENSNNENFLIIRNNPAVTRAYLEEFQRVQGVSRPGFPRVQAEPAD